MSTNRNISRLARNVSLILRSERLIARAYMEALRRQTVLAVFAALIAIMGLVMLNLAGFHALTTALPPWGAAFVVAGADFLLAVLILLIASRQSPGHEIDPATEMRDLAISELEADLDDAVTDMRDIATSLRKVARDPLGSALPALIGPLLTLLVKNTSKKDD